MKKYHGNRKYTKEHILEECVKYKTKSEFVQKNPRVFRSARAFGKDFFEQACSHMTSFRFSSPQLMCKKILESVLEEPCSYNDRTTLGGLELDIFFKQFNLAVEYNGVVWHEKEVVTERDERKKKRCKELGICLVIVRQERIDPIFYEKDVKNALIENLERINAASEKNIVAKDILAVDCSDIFDEVAEAANRTPEKIKEKMVDCSSITEFKEKYYSDYRFLLRNKKTYLLDDIRKYSKDISEEEAIEASRSFSSLSEFRSKNFSAFDACRRKGIMSKVREHLPAKGGSYSFFTDSQLIDAAKQRVSAEKEITGPIKRELEKRGLSNSF